MNTRARPEAGDQDNADFKFLGSDLHHVKAGFDSREPAEAPEGARRFPRREERDVPKGTLADRLRSGRRKGE